MNFSPNSPGRMETLSSSKLDIDDFLSKAILGERP